MGTEGEREERHKRQRQDDYDLKKNLKKSVKRIFNRIMKRNFEMRIKRNLKDL